MATIDYLWKTPGVAKTYTSALSLHGHTLFSKESLDFIIAQAKQSAVLRWALGTQVKRCKNPKADFARAYWTPPLTPRGAYEVERNQIENRLGLSGMVSITDHDNIDAPIRLRLLPQTRHIPISLEWTVPFESIKIHLGIHNLPSSSARRWLSEMQEYTHEMKEERLPGLLQGLYEIKDLLIVLNHPMWDLCAVGQPSHLAALEHFLRRYNRFLHAFELGGLRSWSENQRVVDLANSWNQMIVSGGDRHGFEPNAVLNLTNASTFPEFVQEIREHKKSHLLLMPQYQQSLRLRLLHTVNDVARPISGHPFGPGWEDRTFHPDAAGEIQPLSQLWEKPPAFIKTILGAFQMLEARPIKAMIQYIWGGSKNAFRLPPLGEDGGAV
ncbi:MAG: hypothetical protein JXA73_07190 [Acidobacteria bacterium]|nr:hypothetical protein [Acidobacteriota bacterium]